MDQAAKKQHARHMQILLGLLSRDDNRRCFDCPAKSPSFVNITANTFVCTSCSGLLREFGHRIKSVGASTFTTAEIAAIAGGNSMARQIWMGTWSETENGAEPNGHDEHDMRIFLRQKYQLKRFYKEPNAAELAINMTANARSLPLVEKQISIRMVSSADHQQLPRLQMPPPIQSQSPVPSPQPIITPTHTAVETCLPASAAEPTRSTSLLDLQDEVADDFGDFQTQDPTPSPAATIAQAAQQVSTTVAAASSPQLWVADFGALSSTAAALAAAPTTLAKPDDGGQDKYAAFRDLSGRSTNTLLDWGNAKKPAPAQPLFHQQARELANVGAFATAPAVSLSFNAISKPAATATATAMSETPAGFADFASLNSGHSTPSNPWALSPTMKAASSSIASLAPAFTLTAPSTPVHAPATKTKEFSSTGLANNSMAFGDLLAPVLSSMPVKPSMTPRSKNESSLI